MAAEEICRRRSSRCRRNAIFIAGAGIIALFGCSSPAPSKPPGPDAGPIKAQLEVTRLTDGGLRVVIQVPEMAAATLVVVTVLHPDGQSYRRVEKTFAPEVTIPGGWLIEQTILIDEPLEPGLWTIRAEVDGYPPLTTRIPI